MDLLGEGFYNPSESSLLTADPDLKGWDGRMSSIFWMFATHAAEVEVDTETGAVKVIKVAAAHDVGRAINPVTCEQQIEGSVIMGLSNTLFEEFKMEKGRILNDSLADYKLATFSDMPQIVPIIVEAQHREGPFRGQGCGRTGRRGDGTRHCERDFRRRGSSNQRPAHYCGKGMGGLKRKEREGLSLCSAIGKRCNNAGTIGVKKTLDVRYVISLNILARH